MLRYYLGWIVEATNQFPLVHFSQSNIWKEDYKFCTEHMQTKEFCFVSIVTFIDGYMRERFGKKCSDAIYMTLG